jgi:hypothetical protein
MSICTDKIVLFRLVGFQNHSRSSGLYFGDTISYTMDASLGGLDWESLNVSLFVCTGVYANDDALYLPSIQNIILDIESNTINPEYVFPYLPFPIDSYFRNIIIHSSCNIDFNPILRLLNGN